MRYGLEILQQCGKKVKTKSQKIFRPNTSFWRSYRRKPGEGRGGGSFFSPSFHTYGIELKSKREISNFRLVKKTVFTNLLSSKHEKYVKAIYYSG